MSHPLRRNFMVVACGFVVLLSAPPFAIANTPHQDFQRQHYVPSMRRGLGKLVGGLVLELPRTVLDATLSNPPVIGTVVGLMAGAVRAMQTAFSGLVEMSQAFKPWDW